MKLAGFRILEEPRGSRKLAGIPRTRPPRVTLAGFGPAPQVVSKESSLFLKFATPEAVERSSKSFHKMNATAKDRECLTEKGLCEHELSSTGWFRDSLPLGVMFRPILQVQSIGSYLSVESDVPKGNGARKLEPSILADAFLSCGKISLGVACANSRSRRSNLISASNCNNKGLWPSN